MTDIKQALFDMALYKAPREDGFCAGFYQTMWDIVGASLYSFCCRFFETGILPDGVNNTLLTLIPKVTHPELLTYFRPISPCNVGYKVIGKAMTNRLRAITPCLVAPTQSCFVPGRQIVDNILIYHEVLHSMCKKVGRGFMILKIDLEKTYDRLS